ncbi:MAG: hypothetical protein WD771_04715 [Gemmatimonadaceae bacterium]
MSEWRDINAVLSIEVFRVADASAILATKERDGCRGVSEALGKAAKTALESEFPARAKLLWFLADVCKMIIRPESTNGPFQAWFQVGGRRSLILDDLQSDEIELLGQIAREATDPWLQARLADLSWTYRAPRDPQFALLAIDAYRRLPLDSDSLVCDGKECWQRAIVLARLLGDGAGDRLWKIRETLAATFPVVLASKGLPALLISRLLWQLPQQDDFAERIGGQLEPIP